jgi:hypothetical protein
VAKVKKWTALTGERNRKGEAGAPGTKQAPKGAKRAASKSAKRAKPPVRKSAARKAKSPRKAKSARKAGATRSAGAKRAGVKKMKTSKGKKGMVLVRGRQVATTPAVRVAVKPLDPLRKCGPNTTVELLYRVDETVDGRSTPHLVFFDRHGWYCEHGRTCPAVGHAKKYNGQIARVS